MAIVWPLQMPAVPKSVLVSLADNANDAGECWPSIETIATRTCVHRATVIRAITLLEQLGHVSADRSNGRHTRYLIHPADAKPVALCDPSQSATGSTAQPVAERDPSHCATNQSQSATQPVAQSDSNRKEPSRTVKKKEHSDEYDFSSWPCKPDEQIFADWLIVRKKKRAPLTVTAMRSMGAELHKAVELGFSVDGALAECVSRNWQAMKVTWLENLERKAGAGRFATGPPPLGKTASAIHALEGMKHGNRRSDFGADAAPALLELRKPTGS